MTIHRRLNQPGQGGHFSTWYLIKTMLDAGWTVPMSGSGNGGLYDTSNVYDLSQTIYKGGSVPPNGVGIGSEPWGRALCWIVLEDPGGNRQVAFQRSDTLTDFYDGSWACQYSHGGRFGEGQVAGTDWDEETLPDAPDKGVETTTTNNTFRAQGIASITHVAADDVPSPSGEYGVFCVEFVATNAITGVFMIDDLRNTVTGWTHPLTVFASKSYTYTPLSLNYLYGIQSARDSPGTLIGAGTPGERYIIDSYYMKYKAYNTDCLPAYGGTGVDGKDRVFPLAVISPQVSTYIGTSRWLRIPAVSHGYPNTANSLQYLFISDCLIVDLWDGATTPSSI